MLFPLALDLLSIDQNHNISHEKQEIIRYNEFIQFLNLV